MKNAIIAVGLTGMGLIGLYFKVDYSGWVLGIGLFAAVAAL